jgi:hypothetical protein
MSAPHRLCPRCLGAGVVRADDPMADAVACALARAANHLGAPSFVTCEELHHRWNGPPAPETVRAFGSALILRARLRVVGLRCSLADDEATIAIDLLRTTKPGA